MNPPYWGEGGGHPHTPGPAAPVLCCHRQMGRTCRGVRTERGDGLPLHRCLNPVGRDERRDESARSATVGDAPTAPAWRRRFMPARRGDAEPANPTSATESPTGGRTEPGGGDIARVVIEGARLVSTNCAGTCQALPL